MDTHTGLMKLLLDHGGTARYSFWVKCWDAGFHRERAAGIRAKLACCCMGMAFACHPIHARSGQALSPFANAQGILREGSRRVGVEMLRCAQHDKGSSACHGSSKEASSTFKQPILDKQVK